MVYWKLQIRDKPKSKCVDVGNKFTSKRLAKKEGWNLFLANKIRQEDRRKGYKTSPVVDKIRVKQVGKTPKRKPFFKKRKTTKRKTTKRKTTKRKTTKRKTTKRKYTKRRKR